MKKMVILLVFLVSLTVNTPIASALDPFSVGVLIFKGVNAATTVSSDKAKSAEASPNLTLSSDEYQFNKPTLDLLVKAKIEHEKIKLTFLEPMLPVDFSKDRLYRYRGLKETLNGEIIPATILIVGKRNEGENSHTAKVFDAFPQAEEKQWMDQGIDAYKEIVRKHFKTKIE